MKTLASSSRLIVGNDTANGCFPSFLKDRFLSGPQIISFRRPWKFATNGFQNLVSVSQGGVEPVTCLSSDEQAENQASAVENQNAYQLKTVHVKFLLQKECMFGEQFLIIGDDPIFGSWDPSNAIPLNWSDDHRWAVELDIPIGKTIQFKFVLQEKTGNLVWQPGPDRTFQSWETTNTITVCEDWDSAESQTLIEEEQLVNQNEDSHIVPEKSIVSENLNHPNEELVQNTNEKPPVALVDASIAEKPSVESHKELSDDSNILISEENAIIISPFEEHGINISSSEDNAKALIENLEGAYVKESPISYGVPVLVPGLPPTSTISNDAAPHDEVEGDVSIDGVDESADHKIPETNQKQDPFIVAEQEMEAKKSNCDEDHQASDTGKIENDSDLQPLNDTILKNDITWGHKTLLKFFASLRLL